MYICNDNIACILSHITYTITITVFKACEHIDQSSGNATPSLGKFVAEIDKVFPGGCEVVSDERYVGSEMSSH